MSRLDLKVVPFPRIVWVVVFCVVLLAGMAVLYWRVGVVEQSLARVQESVDGIESAPPKALTQKDLDKAVSDLTGLVEGLPDKVKGVLGSGGAQPSRGADKEVIKRLKDNITQIQGHVQTINNVVDKLPTDEGVKSSLQQQEKQISKIIDEVLSVLEDLSRRPEARQEKPKKSS